VFIVRLPVVVMIVLSFARADVLVVDPGGAGDFTKLSTAVAAAANGDTLLVEWGDLAEPGPVIIQAKALTIVGEVPPVPYSSGWPVTVVVRDLVPGQVVVLENLTLAGLASTSSAPATAGLTLQNNFGRVRVQSCSITGGNGNSNAYPDGAAAVSLFISPFAALIGCALNGGDGQSSPDLGIVTGAGGAGISNAGGQLLVSQTSAVGGDGGGDSPGGYPTGGTGGSGAVQGSGTLLVVGSSLHGGDGGIAFQSGNGGNGLDVFGSGKALLLGGSNAHYGSGQFGDNGSYSADGKNIVAPSGAVTNYGGTEHDFDLTSPLREGQAGALMLGGMSSETTLLFFSLESSQLVFTGFQGALTLSPSNLLGPVVFGPPGNQPVSFVAPTLPAGLEALIVYVQPAYSGPSGVSLGTGRVLTLLDESIF